MKFTKSDLGNMVRIFVACSQQGIFDIREYMIIGAVYGRLEKAAAAAENAPDAGEASSSSNCPFQFTEQDVAIYKRVIEVATKKGLFGAAELTTVGVLYNRLQQAATKPADSELPKLENVKGKVPE
jgi:hypothetical protein